MPHHTIGRIGSRGSLRPQPPLLSGVKGMYYLVVKLTMISLKDIAPAPANDINTKFILLDKGKKTVEGQSVTCLTLVADETASVHFQLWRDECDAFEVGDIMLLTNGIFSNSRGYLALRAGKRGKIEKVGEFTMAYVETPNMSEIRWVSDPMSRKFVPAEVLAPYSRIFPPF